MYIVLCAGPGIGKSVLTNRARKMLRGLSDAKIAPSSVTKAALIDVLAESTKVINIPDGKPPQLIFTSLTVISNELTVLVPKYDSTFLGTMTSLYDGDDEYSEQRRTNNLKIDVTNPQINLFAATTPSFLRELMPEGAWDQGFLARCVIPFSAEAIIPPLFGELESTNTIEQELIEDLKKVNEIVGEFFFTPAARKKLIEWHSKGGPPRPNHPRLVNYLTRRSMQVIKLCMAFSVARDDELIITEGDVDQSLDLLLETEAMMPDLFKAMTGGGDKAAMEELWHFVYQSYVKNDKPVREQLIAAFLAERIPSQRVMGVIELMTQAGYLRRSVRPKIGNVYEPADPTRVED